MAASNEVIIERLEHLRCDIQEIKAALEKRGEQDQKFRDEYQREYAKVDGKTEKAHTRIDELNQRMAAMSTQTESNQKALEDLQKAIQPLVTANKILVWIGGVLGVSTVALIWSLITGQAQLVFP